MIAIGEVLIDLTQIGSDAFGIPKYAANPGGAPANAAVAASRLGAKTGLIARVGNDEFGALLRKTLEDNHVDIRGLQVDPNEQTTLAVVSVDQDGERKFSFYREPSADVMLSLTQQELSLLDETKLLHFGSVSLTAEPSRSATLSAVQHARSNGALISYDPNYRAPLWANEAEAIHWMRRPLDKVDIIKISDEETALLAGEDDPALAAKVLSDHGIRLVLITLGAQGVYYRLGKECGSVAGFPVVVADTNGAGDTFFGAFLSRLTTRKDGLDGLTAPELESMLRFANKAASITTSRHGAIPAMPTLTEVEQSLAQHH